jgi:hypothetical protein
VSGAGKAGQAPYFRFRGEKRYLGEKVLEPFSLKDAMRGAMDNPPDKK